jgi:hypothetical protein
MSKTFVSLPSGHASYNVTTFLNFYNLHIAPRSSHYLTTFNLFPKRLMLFSFQQRCELQIVKFIFIAGFIKSLSLSWYRSIQSWPPNPTSTRSILILFSYLNLCLASGPFSSGLSCETLYTPLLSPTHCYMPRPSRSS